MTRALGSLAEGVRIAIAVLADNRIRSALTILGVGIGVSVVVAFGALLNGVRDSVGAAVESAGPDNLFVSRIDLSAVSLTNFSDVVTQLRSRPRLTARDAQLLSRVDGVADAFLSLEFATNVGVGSERIENVEARGFDAGWPEFNDGDFVAGRDFTDAEVREAVPVIVLADGLAESLFGAQDPVGRSVRLTSRLRTIRQEFRVVGVYSPAPNIFTSSITNWAVMPHSAATKYLRERGEQTNIIVVPDEGADPLVVRDAIIAALRQDRGLGPRDENDFAVIASAQLVESVDELFGVIFLVIVGLSSAGLMVGGIGVVGIMLISVTERTREIGVRKALGATRREILWQFLVESGLLTTLGGIAGLLLGFAIALGVGALTPLDASVPLWSVGIALLGAAITGVVFGLVPAFRASRLTPVEALRAE